MSQFSKQMLDREISCEVVLKEFCARGDGQYLADWAKEVDGMAAKGWKVLDCCRHPERLGFWTVVFGRTRTRINSGPN